MRRVNPGNLASSPAGLKSRVRQEQTFPQLPEANVRSPLLNVRIWTDVLGAARDPGGTIDVFCLNVSGNQPTLATPCRARLPRSKMVDVDMTLRTLVVIAALCATSTAVKGVGRSPPGLTCFQRTVVVFKPGPNPGRAASLFSAHLSFTVSNLRAGTLISAGPFSEAKGGAMIFRKKDWTAIERILNREPFTKGGVFAIDRHFVWDACQLAK